MGAILRGHTGQEDFLQSLRRRYMIDAVNFMALDKIARDCMGDATGTGKNTEKKKLETTPKSAIGHSNTICTIRHKKLAKTTNSSSCCA